MKKNSHPAFLLGVLLLLAGSLTAQSSPSAGPWVLQLDPTQTAADFDLADVMHDVHGSFSFKHGTIQFDPATGKIGGEAVFDATSGKTGNSSRDRKMHKDVLESQRYPEIVFRPDHAQGSVPSSGSSIFQVHGVFGIHGAEHEITIPMEVTFAGNTWTAKASFPVPYAKWGMKNPSVLFLRVGDTVNIKLHAGGSVLR